MAKKKVVYDTQFLMNVDSKQLNKNMMEKMIA